MTISKST